MTNPPIRETIREASTASTELDQAELEAWGARVGASGEAPMVIALRGDLGAGKSTLARAIARGAGVHGPLPSPTFNLMFRYPAADGRELVHIDLYRLEKMEEVWEIGWSELPNDDEIVLIEWPERAEAILPQPRWEIELKEGRDPSRRQVTVEAVGEPGSMAGLVDS